MAQELVSQIPGETLVKARGMGSKTLDFIKALMNPTGELGKLIQTMLNSQTVQGPPGTGMTEPGNITNLYTRPELKNPDGTISTTSSVSNEFDGKEVLYPTVVDGQRLTPEQAIQRYQQTGENLGKFDTPAHADIYAEALHNRQANYPQIGPPKPGAGMPEHEFQRRQQDIVKSRVTGTPRQYGPEAEKAIMAGPQVKSDFIGPSISPDVDPVAKTINFVSQLVDNLTGVGAGIGAMAVVGGGKRANAPKLLRATEALRNGIESGVDKGEMIRLMTNYIEQAHSTLYKNFETKMEETPKYQRAVGKGEVRTPGEFVGNQVLKEKSFKKSDPSLIAAELVNRMLKAARTTPSTETHFAIRDALIGGADTLREATNTTYSKERNTGKSAAESAIEGLKARNEKRDELVKGAKSVHKTKDNYARITPEMMRTRFSKVGIDVPESNVAASSYVHNKYNLPKTDKVTKAEVIEPMAGARGQTQSQKQTLAAEQVPAAGMIKDIADKLSAAGRSKDALMLTKYISDRMGGRSKVAPQDVHMLAQILDTAVQQGKTNVVEHISERLNNMLTSKTEGKDLGLGGTSAKITDTTKPKAEMRRPIGKLKPVGSKENPKPIGPTRTHVDPFTFNASPETLKQLVDAGVVENTPEIKRFFLANRQYQSSNPNDVPVRKFNKETNELNIKTPDYTRKPIATGRMTAHDYITHDMYKSYVALAPDYVPQKQKLAIGMLVDMIDKLDTAAGQGDNSSHTSAEAMRKLLSEKLSVIKKAKAVGGSVSEGIGTDTGADVSTNKASANIRDRGGRMEMARGRDALVQNTPQLLKVRGMGKDALVADTYGREVPHAEGEGKKFARATDNAQGMSAGLYNAANDIIKGRPDNTNKDAQQSVEDAHTLLTHIHNAPPWKQPLYRLTRFNSDPAWGLANVGEIVEQPLSSFSTKTKGALSAKVSLGVPYDTVIVLEPGAKGIALKQSLADPQDAYAKMSNGKVGNLFGKELEVLTSGRFEVLSIKRRGVGRNSKTYIRVRQVETIPPKERK